MIDVYARNSPIRDFIEGCFSLELEKNMALYPYQKKKTWPFMIS